MKEDKAFSERLEREIQEGLSFLDDRPSVSGCVLRRLEKKRRSKKTVFVFAALAVFGVVGAAASGLSGRFETYRQMPEYRAKKAVENLTPIPDDAQREDGFYVDGVLYGYIRTQYQTFFETDAELFHEVGLEPMQGVVTWEAFLEAADAVSAYNETHDEPILFAATLPHRFPNTFAPREDEQWARVEKVIGAEGDRRALLTERVLMFQELGAKSYVGGIVYEGKVVPLAQREASVIVWPKGEEMPKKMDVQPAEETGCLPEDMTYSEMKEAWSGYTMLVSEENFELWKQMLHGSELNIEQIESEEP